MSMLVESSEITKMDPATLKYSLQDMHDIRNKGFGFTFDTEIVEMIHYISTSMGLHAPTLSTDFIKHAFVPKIISQSSSSESLKYASKRHRSNKSMEISNNEWESIRSFQATKIEHKTGTNGDIDQLRLLLNKITDKTVSDIREKVITQLDIVVARTDIDDLELKHVAELIYTLSSSNKFYSKLFSTLFSELATKYAFIRKEFNLKYGAVMAEYLNIVYVDPDVNYDEYCDNIKINDRRRALSLFLVNLGLVGFINPEEVLVILHTLLARIEGSIRNAEQKNINDELIENVALLFSGGLFDAVNDDNCDDDIEQDSLTERIRILSMMKAKDCKGLSNKTIFKCMDLIE